MRPRKLPLFIYLVGAACIVVAILAGLRLVPQSPQSESPIGAGPDAAAVHQALQSLPVKYNDPDYKVVRWWHPVDSAAVHAVKVKYTLDQIAACETVMQNIKHTLDDFAAGRRSNEPGAAGFETTRPSEYRLDLLKFKDGLAMWRKNLKELKQTRTTRVCRIQFRAAEYEHGTKIINDMIFEIDGRWARRIEDGPLIGPQEYAAALAEFE